MAEIFQRAHDSFPFSSLIRITLFYHCFLNDFKMDRQVKQINDPLCERTIAKLRKLMAACMFHVKQFSAVFSFAKKTWDALSW